MLYKYKKAMISDEKTKDKADIPKPQLYKGDREDVARFIM